MIVAQITMDSVMEMQKLSEKEQYEAFVEKFKPKVTTDDCLTPPEVFDAIAGWVCCEYGIKTEQIVRPFWPGADYETTDYPDGCVVVDNPPFSIESKILSFYLNRGIRFFLFAPSLTLCSCVRDKDATIIVTNSDIVYANGAKVRTGFITNLDERNRIRTAPVLSKIINEEVKKLRAKDKRVMPKYSYPDCIISSANLQRIACIDFAVPKSEAVFISEIDEQKAKGKAIFGGGLLISERAAVERAAAERAAVERWHLSEREKKIQRGLQSSAE